MKQKILNSILFAMFLAAALTSCANKAADPHKYLPSITGNAGEVLVVIDKNHWEGVPGSRLREVLASEYPYLPQREPYFRLYNTPASEFKGAFMVFRNIVIVNISEDTDSSGVVVRQNAWAKPQVVVTINAEDAEDASEVILRNSKWITDVIEQAERDRVITGAKLYEDAAVREAVTANIGGSPYFPKGFTIKKNTPDFMWISQETTHVNQGILIFKYPYESEDQLTPESIIAKLGDLWQANVPGMRENSYMIFNKMFVPSVTPIVYKGMNMIEVRSLWEVENDYMGGPLVCHIFPDKERKNLIVLNAFVYAPKYDKRKYLRQVESIIFSFEWK